MRWRRTCAAAARIRASCTRSGAHPSRWHERETIMSALKNEPKINASRRDFLKTGGALVVTFAAGGSATNAGGAAHAMPKAKTVATDEVAGFLAIDANGDVTVYSGKVDLGTGVRTAMTQIAAEELSVPLSKVTVIQGDTLLTPDQGVTFGSLSIQNGGKQIRKAAGTARVALLAERAAKLGAAKDALDLKDRVLGPTFCCAAVTYSQVIRGADVTSLWGPN